MPPARREPRYSVQDVIDMVQNGESEVEMEISDTDESDEAVTLVSSFAGPEP